ncbi:MAG: acyltransferase family protein [Acidimicrobiales bacterium]
MQPAPTDKPHFILGFRGSLDGIRGSAMCLVLVVHATYLLVPRYSGLYVPGGFIAVDSFFVLSGFLITSLLVEERAKYGRVSFRKFYLRRALRLFPALWVVIIAQLIYTVVFGDPLKGDVEGLAYILFYVTNWATTFNGPVPFGMGQMWSLAVEEQFYLLWPALLVILLRRSRSMFVSVAMILIAVALVSRVVLWHSGLGWEQIYVQTETRFDDLIMGALLAYGLSVGWRSPRWVSWLVGPSVAFLLWVIVAVHRADGWLYDGGYTVVAAALTAVIWAAVQPRHWVARVLSWRPFQVIGVCSYSLYLWHVLIFEGLYRSAAGRPPAELLVMGFGLTFVAGFGSRYLVERPFLRMKNRFGRRPPSAKLLAEGSA